MKLPKGLFLTDVTLCDASGLEPTGGPSGEDTEPGAAPQTCISALPGDAPGGESTLARSVRLESTDRLAALVQNGSLNRVEAPAAWLRNDIGPIQVFLDGETAGLSIRCAPTPESVPLRQPGIQAVTLWVDSASSLARRTAGEARPGSAMRLREAVDLVRRAGVECVVAFPLEVERIRTLLNFGYLVQSYGADRIRLVEGSGRVHPLDLFRTIRALRERLSIPLEVDLSDTWGLAVGGALCAIRAGVRHTVVSTQLGSHLKHIPLGPLQGCLSSIQGQPSPGEETIDRDP